MTARATPRQLRGVFIGIDRYRSTGIGELRYAERDARALQSLFSDTLGPGAELLVGGNRVTASGRAFPS